MSKGDGTHFRHMASNEQLTLNEKLRDGTDTGKPNIPEASDKPPLDVNRHDGKSVKVRRG